MVELFTSRWANRRLAELECVPVGISRGVPRFPTGYEYRLARWLAPSRATFALEDPHEYEASYVRQLEDLGVPTILARLERISNEAGALPLTLLCYEDLSQPGQWCHRQYLSTWLWGRGVAIKELECGDVPRRPDSPQLTLFDGEERA